MVPFSCGYLISTETTVWCEINCINDIVIVYVLISC